MRKFLSIAIMALAMTFASCGNDSKATDSVVATDSISDSVATCIVPQAATEVIPCAAPGPDAGGKVATEVIADSVK